MGCASSFFADTVAASGVIDLNFAHNMTDAEAVALSRAVHEHRPVSLRMPRFACPSSKLSGDGLSQLCIAGAGSLTTVELNEAALPRVTAEAAAQALGLLGDVREVSIRGGSWPRQILSFLGDHATMPLTTVRTVLLGGAGVDSIALAALPKAFPCCTELYIQSPDVAWVSALPSLVAKGVLFTHVDRFVVDSSVPLDSAAAKAVEALCPQLVVAAQRTQFTGPSLVQITGIGGVNSGPNSSHIIGSPRAIESQIRFTAPSAVTAPRTSQRNTNSGDSPLITLDATAKTPHHQDTPTSPRRVDDLLSPSVRSGRGDDPPAHRSAPPPLRTYAVPRPRPSRDTGSKKLNQSDKPAEESTGNNPLEQAPSERSVSSQSLQDIYAQSCSTALTSLSIGTMDSSRNGQRIAPPPLSGFVRPRPQGGYVRAAPNCVTADAARSAAGCVVRAAPSHCDIPCE